MLDNPVQRISQREKIKKGLTNRPYLLLTRTADDGSDHL